MAKARAAHAERGAELDAALARLCREAREHPELSMTEAAKLGGLGRRATAYDFADRAED